MSGPYRLGVDVGGTFTDILALDENTGEVRVAKVLKSTVIEIRSKLDWQ